MLAVHGGLAEFERELIRARTGEGRERARARGVKMGPKFKLTAHQQRDIKGEPLREIARTFNVSQARFHGLRHDRDHPAQDQSREEHAPVLQPLSAAMAESTNLRWQGKLPADPGLLKRHSVFMCGIRGLRRAHSRHGERPLRPAGSLIAALSRAAARL